MRRVLLLIGGICGSILVGWQLVVSARSILENGQEAVTAETIPVYADTMQSLQMFPIAISGTSLVAQYPVLYEGPFVEDGSYEYVVDVAALVLFNTARTGIEHAQVVLQWDQGAYVFEAEMIPAREAVLVLDKSRQKFAQHDWTDCTGSQMEGDGVWLDQDILLVENVDMQTVCVYNTTQNTLHNIRIYYKSYLASNDLYIGGITYSLGIRELAPGESVRISPFRYTRDYSKVVRIRYSNGE